MAIKTPNFGFTKPEKNEHYNIDIQNENWNKVDKQMIPCIAKYYSTVSAMNADEVIDPFALIPISSEVNPDLFNIVGGSFAWVWTNFYIAASTTSRRMQIAMSYNTIHHKIAFRIYGTNGWLEWKELATADKVPSLDANGKVLGEQLPDMFTYGTTDLTPGTSELETGKLYFVYE